MLASVRHERGKLGNGVIPSHIWPTERRRRSNFQSRMPTRIVKEVTAGAFPIRTQVPLTRERLKRRIPLYHY